MKYAKVIVDVPASAINQTFDYRVPEQFSDVIQKGCRVLIPFGPRKITGFVVELTNETSLTKLKDIIDVLDITPVLTDELIELGKWLAEDIICLYISAFQAMLPAVLKAKYDKEVVKLTDEALTIELDNVFQGRDSVSYDELVAANIRYSQLRKAIDEGLLMIHYDVKSKVTKQYRTMIRSALATHQLIEIAENDLTRAKKQREIVQSFIDNPEVIEQNQLLKRVGTGLSTLKALIEKGILHAEKVEVLRNPYDDNAFEKTEKLLLTEEQQTAIEPINEALDHKKHDVFLLHGVTGSGKTEIYLQAIEKVIQQGKEAIVLVPEISLTPQMVRRFKGRFGSKVAVLHSALSQGEKYDEWRRIHRKEVQVVVGARSAVFAPFENLGIIIIDEEHESTYKQEDQPRYHARDVAIYRGNFHQCPVVLGSATPTLESFARAQKGIYKLLSLTKRTNEQEMPEIQIVDMREELHRGNRTMFSLELKEKIEACIARGEQIVLLLNRRGYSTFVMCRDCGHVQQCPHCDIALTYHKQHHRMKCHYCSHEEPVPHTCPKCSSDLIRFFGTGTERVEEAINQLIPQASVIRMDVDTTRRKGAHEKLLQRFANKEADILLGTQMIAKGLDFPNVTLVGVLTADSMLHLPDFRAAERTFQLLTQVSGRAGRHQLPGEVIIQTYTTEHYSIEHAKNYDFLAFYEQEMRTRRTFQYPPYVYLALINVSHPNQVKVMQTTQTIVQLLHQKLSDQTRILGPTPSPLSRIKNRYRYQCLIKYKHEPEIRKTIQMILHHFSKEMENDDLTITIDMQPHQLT